MLVENGNFQLSDQNMQLHSGFQTPLVIMEVEIQQFPSLLEKVSV